MPAPSAEASVLARAFELALAEAPRRGLAGAVLGRGPGASLEFHDRRSYAAGDDVRHLDWRAFARTDQLMVRLHREEVAPELDLLIDGSASMAVEPAKAQLAVDLVQFVAVAARAGGYRVRLVRLDERPEVLDLDRFEAEGLEHDGRTDLARSLGAAAPLLRPDSVRLLVSDLLSPADAAPLVRDLATRAGGLALVQVLGALDADPPGGEAARLVDAETGDAVDLVLDRATVERYRERLARLEGAWADAARRRGGLFVRAVASEPLEALARGPLIRAGVVQPA